MTKFDLERRGTRSSKYQGLGPHPLTDPVPHHSLFWGTENNYRLNFNPQEASSNYAIPPFWAHQASYNKEPRVLRTACHKIEALQRVLWALEFAVQVFDYAVEPKSMMVNNLRLQIPLQTGPLLRLRLDFDQIGMLSVHLIIYYPDEPRELCPLIPILYTSTCLAHPSSLYALPFNPLLSPPSPTASDDLAYLWPEYLQTPSPFPSPLQSPTRF